MFLLLGLGAYFGYTRGSLTGRQQAKGRWVYDRSLGGKKVRGATRQCFVSNPRHILSGVLLPSRRVATPPLQNTLSLELATLT
jgi:hypothetical protein